MMGLETILSMVEQEMIHYMVMMVMTHLMVVLVLIPIQEELGLMSLLLKQIMAVLQ